MKNRFITSDRMTPEERLERLMFWFYGQPRPKYRANARRELRRSLRPRKFSKPQLEKAE